MTSATCRTQDSSAYQICYDPAHQITGRAATPYTRNMELLTQDGLGSDRACEEVQKIAASGHRNDFDGCMGISATTQHILQRRLT